MQRRHSVLEITRVEDLKDPLMGTTDKIRTCTKCEGGWKECTGHFGHLELAHPMYHIGFMKNILHVLQCVCYRCSKILADERDDMFREALRIKDPKRRFERILKVCKGKERCDDDEQHGGCGTAKPTKIFVVNKFNIRRKFGNQDDVEATEFARDKSSVSASDGSNGYSDHLLSAKFPFAFKKASAAL
ncbi:hypothetical protein RIF29_37031 [Crotalaria pallida]|uniref:DNA-directed RNA polymerase n=1 Tax=Crotalaria pallida TaxID=3830 RepID=A0AAN9EBW8_CROPI